MVAHEVFEPPSVHGYQAIVKRAMDVTLGSTLLLLAAPLMALIAIAIRFDTRGPVIFRQQREGRRGRTFEALKFRTMRDAPQADALEQLEADDISFLSKPENDPRITRVGRWLRRTSLDELPQLWSVVRGDMSLVGPRPLPLWEAERLGLHRRLIVRPGLTGLWQVSGRSSLAPDERIRLDLVYVQNWSVLLDLSILLRTVPAVIGGNGAY
jgi:lipopolysaccharide/colanic/teichoic acid biosynthesis glycosyltransferase